MACEMEIHDTGLAERSDILAIYPFAFPEEDLRPLVLELLEGSEGTLSLGARVEGKVVGHVLFTGFADTSEAAGGALLGPLAITPGFQGKGLGSALVRAGLDRLNDDGVRQVFVLGNPAYYGRFGFASERDVLPPYDLPPVWDGAWQSLSLSDRPTLAAGRCVLADPWMNRALWMP